MAEARNVFVEFHALTSHAPSNLNRDELGTPKTAVFGGARRLRISSQCLKRTWRMSEFFRGVFAEDLLGIRTARIPEKLKEELTKEKLSADVIDGLVALLGSVGTGAPKKDGKDGEAGDDQDEAADAGAVAETKHLLFLSRQEIEEVKNFARAEAKKLADVFEAKAGKKKRVPNPEKIDALRQALAAHLAETCRRNAVDVALFGRFVTSDEFRSVDAAMQVAHALGTQKVEVEYDYFSAVDDLATGRGAGHIGETEFASSVFYKYAVCDLAQLLENVGGDAAVSARAMRALALAIARAVPIGKKNGTAPQNPADHLEVVVRRDAPVSLANAFLRPVAPNRDSDVMDESIRRMRDQARRYQVSYGEDVLGRFILPLREVEMPPGATRCATLDELAAKVEELVRQQAAGLAART
jgi:CRISPR system Cascade subunit CasC